MLTRPRTKLMFQSTLHIGSRPTLECLLSFMLWKSILQACWCQHETGMEALLPCNIVKGKPSSDGVARASIDMSEIGGAIHRLTRIGNGSCGTVSHVLISWPTLLHALMYGGPVEEFDDYDAPCM